MSNNKRLHVELALIQLAGISGEKTVEKKTEKLIEKKKTVEPKPEIKENKEKKSEPKEKEEVHDVKKPEVREQKTDDSIPTTKSIGNLLKNKGKIESSTSEKQENNKEPKEEIKDADYNEKELLEAWNSFKQTISDSRLSTVLDTSKLRYIDKNNLKIEFETDLQKKTFIKEIMDKLRHHLYAKLNNNNIEMELKVKEKSKEKKKIYTDSDKMAHFKKKNPAVKDLQQRFKLDFE